MSLEPDLGTFSGILIAAVTAAGAIIAAMWLGIVLWTFRDMRSRSRDSLAQIAAALMVAILNIFGLIIYLMLRPRETLAEAYARSLEEEALLQEIEEKPICPGCGRASLETWQVCPHCHTRLKKPCIQCGQMLELAWNICPYCATSQVTPSLATQAELAPKRNVTSRPIPAVEQARAEAYALAERQFELSPEAVRSEPLKYIANDEY